MGEWAILTGFLQDLAGDAGFASQTDLPKCLSDGISILRVKRASVVMKLQGVN